VSDAAAWLASAVSQRAGYTGPLSLQPPTPGDAAARWRACGLAELTGAQEGPLIRPTRDYAARLEALIRVTQAFAARLGGDPRSLAMALYGERAADLGLGRRGAISAGGAARMVRCADDWAVINLARPEDLELFEAWIGAPAGDDAWTTLLSAARRLDSETLIDRGRLLGLPLARVASTRDEQQAARPDQAHGAPHIQRWAPVAAPRNPAELLVVDLSGLWAGRIADLLRTDERREGNRRVRLQN
jgi:hypothetical protein